MRLTTDKPRREDLEETGGAGIRGWLRGECFLRGLCDG